MEELQQTWNVVLVPQILNVSEAPETVCNTVYGFVQFFGRVCHGIRDVSRE